MNNEPTPSQWDQITARFDEGDARMGRIEAELKKNTDDTAVVKRDTGELLELLRSWKGAFKVLNWIGRLAKPLGYIAFAIGAVVAAVKGVQR